MSEEGRRKVVSSDVDRYGDARETGRELIDPLVLSVERTRRWMVGLVIVLAAVLVGVTVALYFAIRPTDISITGGQGAGAPMQWIQSIYGIGPAPEDLLVAPTSVAVSPSGDIFVAEPQRGRVLVFGAGGSFERELVVAGMDRPESVTVDEFGALFVADPSARRVFVFDMGGALIRELVSDDTPLGVAVDGDRAYVLGQGRIYEYEVSSGKELGWFGSFGTNPGELDAYQGIVVHRGTLYVADALNRRLQAFDTDGTLLWVSNGSASEAESGHWQLPQDLTLDGAGRLVVVDALNFQVAAVDADSGVLLDWWGSFGRRDGSFSYPSSIAYDEPRDRFVIADTKNDRIQIVTLPGSTEVAEGVVTQAVAGPWRHLVVPSTAVLASIVVWYCLRRLRRRRRQMVV